MISVDIEKLKLNFDDFIKTIEEDKSNSIVILNNDKPVAKIVPYFKKSEQRIGIAKGKWPDISEAKFNNFDLCSIMTGEK